MQQVKKMITQLVVCWTISYFKNYYKMTGIDLSKQQALDPDIKPIQKINFTGSLKRRTRTFSLLNKQNKEL